VHQRERHVKKRRIAVLVALGFMATMAGWTTCIEPGRLVWNRQEIELDTWPPRFDGIRIAAVADLHVGSPRNGLDRLREIVRLVNAAKPDLVLLPGDFVIHGVLGGHFVEPEAITAELARISAPLGTFAVLGNHDCWFDAERVAAALERV